MPSSTRYKNGMFPPERIVCLTEETLYLHLRVMAKAELPCQYRATTGPPPPKR